MKKINKHFCIPFIIICIALILYMCYFPCLPQNLRISNSILVIAIMFSIVVVGIFTDSTYVIREKYFKGRKNEKTIK